MGAHLAQEIFPEAYATAVYRSKKSPNALSESTLCSCSFDTVGAQYEACTNHLTADPAQMPPERVPAPTEQVPKWVPPPDTTL